MKVSHLLPYLCKKIMTCHQATALVSIALLSKLKHLIKARDWTVDAHYINISISLTVKLLWSVPHFTVISVSLMCVWRLQLTFQCSPSKQPSPLMYSWVTIVLGTLKLVACVAFVVSLFNRALFKCLRDYHIQRDLLSFSNPLNLLNNVINNSLWWCGDVITPL